MLARLQNTLVAALNKTKSHVLPKYILVILDDDLISYLNYSKDGAATLLGSWIEWLVGKFNEAVNDRKRQLPTKCVRYDTFFYWVAAPTHSFFSSERNKLRIKYNLSLESVIRSQPNMRVVKLKEFWDSRNSCLVINDRITEDGMSTYWKSIDATFQFNSERRDIFLAKKITGANKTTTTTDVRRVINDSGTRRQSTVSSTVSIPTAGDASTLDDPMIEFFRRHERRRHDNIRQERYMNAQEDVFQDREMSNLYDSSHRRQDNRRFILPKPKSFNKNYR